MKINLKRYLKYCISQTIQLEKDFMNGPFVVFLKTMINEYDVTRLLINCSRTCSLCFSCSTSCTRAGDASP